MVESASFPRSIGSEIEDRLRTILRPDWYLKRFPDVQKSEVDPRDHYLSEGVWENRDPNPLFDGAWYRRTYEVPHEIPPILHYLTVGAGLGFAPGPFFDVDHYRRRANVKAWNQSDLEHYLTQGWKQPTDPHPIFSCAWYLVRSRLAFGPEWSPFEDYVSRTGDAIISGSPWFSEADYLLQRPDVARLQLHPLYHWLQIGFREGFPKNWIFESKPYGPIGRDESITLTTDPIYRLAENEGAQSPETNGDSFRTALSRHLANRLRSFKKRVSAAVDGQRLHIDWASWAASISLPFSDTPTVSIVIPTLDHLEDVVLTLDSIAATKEKTPFEVILVDDCSTIEVSSLFQTIRGIRLVTHVENQGFAGACESGIKHSKGKYVLLLNNDVEVVSGWLDALASVLEVDATVGAVGSMLIRPDNRLQEAGVIVWSDGTGWQVGHGESPFDPRFRTQRIVDYCSGASLLVRRSTWDSIGGFDPRFRPAYYEDTDFCFQVAQRGEKVVYVPRSVVFHNEGSTHGRTDTGAKRFQHQNQPKFREKWATVLNDREIVPKNGPTREMVLRANHRPTSPIVLVVDHKELTPDMDSGSLRLHRIIQEFVTQGRHVIFHAVQGVPNSRWASEVADSGVEVYGPEAPIEDVLRGLGDQIEFVWISRPQVLLDFAATLLRWAPQIPVVYDMVDAHGLRLAREASAKHSREIALQSRRERGQERAAARLADVVVALSESDEAYMRSIAEIDLRTVRIPNVHSGMPTKTPFGDRSGLLFVGGYEHEPNVDAAKHLIENVMPIVWSRIGDVPVTLAGSNPTDEIQKLSSDLVKVPGWIPNLEPLYEGHRIAVAPLRYGAGVKGKVGEGMALGVPTISTSVGVEGMACSPGTDILVADNPDEFAEAIITLYLDSALWQKLARNSPVTIENEFGAKALSRRVMELFAAVGSSTNHAERSQIPYTT